MQIRAASLYRGALGAGEAISESEVRDKDLPPEVKQAMMNTKTSLEL